jgi:hypothetical protein
VYLGSKRIRTSVELGDLRIDPPTIGEASGEVDPLDRPSPHVPVLIGAGQRQRPFGLEEFFRQVVQVRIDAGLDLGNLRLVRGNLLLALGDPRLVLGCFAVERGLVGRMVAPVDPFTLQCGQLVRVVGKLLGGFAVEPRPPEVLVHSGLAAGGSGKCFGWINRH